jgi:hypothetical protein
LASEGEQMPIERAAGVAVDALTALGTVDNSDVPAR